MLELIYANCSKAAELRELASDTLRRSDEEEYNGHFTVIKYALAILDSLVGRAGARQSISRICFRKSPFIK